MIFCSMLSLMIGLVEPCFAEQSAADISRINRRIIIQVKAEFEKQGMDRLIVRRAFSRVEELLNENDLHMAEHILTHIEQNGTYTDRSVFLRSLGSIGSLEDSTAFDRLLDYFEKPTTADSDRAMAGESWVVAGIRSGNAILYQKLIARIRNCKNQEALRSYIMVLEKEQAWLVSADWYFPFILKTLRDPNVSAQVRVTCANTLIKAIWIYGPVAKDSELGTQIRTELVAALQTEPDAAARILMIGSLTDATYVIDESVIRDLRFESPDREVRLAAARVLFFARGGRTQFPASVTQTLINTRARSLGLVDRAKEICLSWLR